MNARPAALLRYHDLPIPKPTYSIRILSGRAKGVTFPIDAPRTLLGRGPGVYLAFHDPALHRTHLEVEAHHDHVSARAIWPGDTFVWQGSTVKQACLHDGDVLTLGSVRFQIERRSD